MDDINVIIRPLITEKSTHLQATRNCYSFEVHREANKRQVMREESGAELSGLHSRTPCILWASLQSLRTAAPPSHPSEFHLAQS